jgi:deazaflavin-dependent oxidoreductase (nitroreductase family)
VIAVPDGDNLVAVASNWGRRHHPAWYYNLCAHPTATVTVGGVSRRVQAHKVTDEERDRLWQQNLEVYPGGPSVSGVPRIGGSIPRGDAGFGARQAWLTRENLWAGVGMGEPR